MTPKEIKGNRLKRKGRNGKPCTQEEFSRLMGVGLHTVSLWEAGKRNPSLSAQMLMNLDCKTLNKIRVV